MYSKHVVVASVELFKNLPVSEQVQIPKKEDTMKKRQTTKPCSVKKTKKQLTPSVNH